MFNRFVEVNNGKRHLVIILDTYGKFPQHYVKTKGWYTCLDRWAVCPFCRADNGKKYQRKIKYYFNVVELDQDSNNQLPKVLLLSKSRGESLLRTFASSGKSLMYTGFYFSKKPIGACVEFSESQVSSDQFTDMIRYDWSVICKPLTVEKAQEIVDNDPHDYQNVVE